MLKFYAEYLANWWGLSILSVLAVVLYVTTKRLLQWKFPQVYTEQTLQDQMLIELHYRIACLAGLLAYFASIAPMLPALAGAPPTLFIFVFILALVVSGIKILSFAWFTSALLCEISRERRQTQAVRSR